MGTELIVHECGCTDCQDGDHPAREDHRQLNLLLSRLDEQQRRWVAGREAKSPGTWWFSANRRDHRPSSRNDSAGSRRTQGRIAKSTPRPGPTARRWAGLIRRGHVQQGVGLIVLAHELFDAVSQVGPARAFTLQQRRRSPGSAMAMTAANKSSSFTELVLRLTQRNRRAKGAVAVEKILFSRRDRRR